MADAVRRNPATSRATDVEVENEIKNWLKFAKDRDGGRRERYLRAQQQAQNSSSTLSAEATDH